LKERILLLLSVIQLRDEIGGGHTQEPSRREL
jgi:hypothetical protein